jgi:hypothetical protein
MADAGGYSAASKFTWQRGGLTIASSGVGKAADGTTGYCPDCDRKTLIVGGTCQECGLDGLPIGGDGTQESDADTSFMSGSASGTK